ncbi:redoxin domain-containing protein [Flavobacterium enshiense]|uniref:redoxin domain-containing protein n=1 Tax=Flavobacterium enshiense TaxID=1341165 RepID=UPI00345CB495
MNTMLSNFKSAFVAEHIKKKGVGIYYTSFALGIIAPILFFIVILFQETNIPKKMPYLYYMEFLYDVSVPFISFFLPILIIINASKIAQIDHKNGGWQLMETLPLQKTSIYFSKFCILLVSNIIAIVSFMLPALFFAWLITFFKEISEVALFDFPAMEMLNLAARIFMATLFLTAFQYFLSVLISGFIWPLLIGFLGLIMAPILKSFGLAIDWFPFEILIRVSDFSDGSNIGNWFLYTEKISFVGSVFFLLLGYFWYTGKTFVRAFLFSGKKIAVSVFVLGSFGLLMFLFLKPNTYATVEKTVVAGHVKTDSKFRKAFLIHPFIGDTLAQIAIQNGTFNQSIAGKLPLDTYKMVFDGGFSLDLVLSAKDSVFIDVAFYNNNSEVTISGTRLAENQYKSDGLDDWSMVNYDLESNRNLDRPDYIMNALYKEWKKKYDRANAFKTRDNFIPREDFSDRKRKDITVAYLGYLNKFLDKRKALYPNEKTELTEDIRTMKAAIRLNDESMIGNKPYVDYVLHELSHSGNDDTDSRTKQIEAIAKLQSGNFKSRLLFSCLKGYLEEATSVIERKNLVDNYANQIEDEHLRANIQNYYNIYERLGRGNVARDFAATSLSGQRLSLENLKGKFVVIDVWATWCGPCQYQSPFFEKMALKYQKENVRFVGLSVDKDAKKWFVDAKNKPKSILQLHADNADKLAADYNLGSIPRFILIDPLGKIYNSSLPFPGEASFEMILRKALKLEELE